MKITATPVPLRSSSRPFPKLMVSHDGQQIVLFISAGSGFALTCSQGRQHYYSQYWSSAEFSDYTGTVTIQDGDQ